MNRIGPSCHAMHAFDVPFPPQIGAGFQAWWTAQRPASITLTNSSMTNQGVFTLWSYLGHLVVSADAAILDPLGGNSAYRVMEDAGNFYRYLGGEAINRVVPGPSTCECYVRPINGRNTCAMAFSTGTCWATYRFSDLATQSSAGLTPLIVPAANGWYKLTLYGEAAAPGSMYISPYAGAWGTSPDNIYVGDITKGIHAFQDPAYSAWRQTRVSAVADQGLNGYNFIQAAIINQPYWQYNTITGKNEICQPGTTIKSLINVTPAFLASFSGLDKPYSIAVRARETIGAPASSRWSQVQGGGGISLAALLVSAPNMFNNRNDGVLNKFVLTAIPNTNLHTWIATFNGVDLLLYLDGVLVAGPANGQCAAMVATQINNNFANSAATSASFYSSALSAQDVLLLTHSHLAYG